MLNVVTIHAIRKTSSLPKTLKTLLLSLAVSDVGVGLLVQPFYTSLLAEWIQQNNPGCSTYKVFDIIAYFFCLASFFGVEAVSVDRFLAIHLHLRYQELVTHKRVVAVVISNWVLSAFLSLLMLWVPFDVKGLYIHTWICFCLCYNPGLHQDLFSRTTPQESDSGPTSKQVAQNGEMANFSSLIKFAVGIFYFYIVFLVCYLPQFTFLMAIGISGPSIALKKFNLFATTLVYLNSSLNPVIYCWKMRHIRYAVIDILRNTSWLRNRASH